MFAKIKKVSDAEQKGVLCNTQTDGISVSISIFAEKCTCFNLPNPHILLAVPTLHYHLLIRSLIISPCIENLALISLF